MLRSALKRNPPARIRRVIDAQLDHYEPPRGRQIRHLVVAADEPVQPDYPWNYPWMFDCLGSHEDPTSALGVAYQRNERTVMVYVRDVPPAFGWPGHIVVIARDDDHRLPSALTRNVA